MTSTAKLWSELQELNEIVKEISHCTACILSKTRTQTVPGTGNSKAEIMFVGEAPGFNEDQQGIPFVGRAGNLLIELLSSIEMNRESVYVTNLVKCRPPKNRDPNTQEIDACRKFLEMQILQINPKIIVTLGRHAFSFFFPHTDAKSARGKFMALKNLTIFPIYHPAAALYNPKLKSVLKQDFRKISAFIQNYPKQEESTKTTSNTTKQLSFFE